MQNLTPSVEKCITKIASYFLRVGMLFFIVPIYVGKSRKNYKQKC